MIVTSADLLFLHGDGEYESARRDAAQLLSYLIGNFSVSYQTKMILTPAALLFGHGEGENPEARPADDEARDLSEETRSNGAAPRRQCDYVSEGRQMQFGDPFSG